MRTHRDEFFAIVALVVGVACLVVFLGRSEAAVVRTSYAIQEIWVEDPFGVDPSSHTIYCNFAPADPDAPSWDVFGAGVFPAVPVLCTSETFYGVPSPIDCQTLDPVTFEPDGQFLATVDPASAAAGTTACLDPPACTKWSLINTISSASGPMQDQFMANLPAGSRLVYTTDGMETNKHYCFNCVTQIPGCPAPPGFQVRSDLYLSINAYVDGETVVGTNVTTASDTSFFNPITFEPVPITVDVTFSEVTEAGRTMVVVASNYNGNMGDFGIAAYGFQASFLDITTTASFTGPITICTHYPDDDPNDGLIDGTSIPETELRVLHGEDGEFIDRTSTRDVESNVVCGTVDHLSPFVATVPEPFRCDPAPKDCIGRRLFSLKIARDPANSGKNSMKLKIKTDDALALSQLGRPGEDTDYNVCLYDEDGLLLEVPLRSAAPTWAALGSSGYKFKDKTGMNSGIGSFLVKGGDSTMIKLKGKGINLPMPVRMPATLTGLFPSAKLQIVNEAGLCWSGFNFVSENTATRLTY